MGYTGERCQDLVDNCVSGVCLNGGECINALNSFSCHCAPGFTGELCDVNINECASNPCHNRGTCVDKVSDYECVCPDTVDGTSPSKNCSGGSLVYSCLIRFVLPWRLLPIPPQVLPVRMCFVGRIVLVLMLGTKLFVSVLLGQLGSSVKDLHQVCLILCYYAW